jgi:sarcosine oxidase subunit gamma
MKGGRSRIGETVHVPVNGTLVPVEVTGSVLGRGSSAQTALGQAGAVLLAPSDAGDDYLVFVRSSFAGYVADWLLDAALEFTST